MKRTREDRFPETDCFHLYNANPKNRYTSDCVIRALCTALKIPYNTVVRELAELQCKTGYDSSENKCIDLYLKDKGWIKHRQPRKVDNTKYTGEDFYKVVGKSSTAICNIGGHHIVAFINGKVWDNWNSTAGCIGNYWTKQLEVIK